MFDDLRHARAWSDWVQEGQRVDAELVAEAEYFGTLGERPRWAGFGRAEAPPPGLVSVPTSGRATESEALISQRTALADALQAFAPDPAVNRWARLRRSIGAAARCIDAITVEKVRTIMLTLTYARGNQDWEPRHISDFLKRVRRHLQSIDVPFRYVWVAEIQTGRLKSSGVAAIHYHVAVWLPEGVSLPKPDDSGWWPWGLTRIETARRAVPYLMHYLQKSSSVTREALPLGARCHGRGGLGEKYRAVLRWLSLPAFIQARASVHQRWIRAVGGGWTCPQGTHWASEFARVCIAGVWHLQRVADHGRPFKADGPFSWASGHS